MDKFIQKLKGKSIHVVGVTGAEGSNILKFLIKHRLTNIAAHDYSHPDNLENNFKEWHKSISNIEKERLYQQFVSDLSLVKLNTGKDYLKDILSADIIFVPQSWRLYKSQNSLLWQAKKKGILFYSLTRLYLELTKATVIGVTGTVGKGSVANLIYQLLVKSGKKVYFAGNETWMRQLADKLDEMKKEDILVLEISHRQLLDGISRAPHVVVFTNLYPNHLNEMSWDDYRKIKLSLLRAQKSDDYAILNYDDVILRNISKELKSKVFYYSEEIRNMNTESVQYIYNILMNNNSIHYNINILAAITAVELLGIKSDQSAKYLSKTTALPARLQPMGDIHGVNFYDDIKSTTPWATLSAINKLGSNTILICGGDTKGIDYSDFCKKIKNKIKRVISLESELAKLLKKVISDKLMISTDNLAKAIEIAYQYADKGDNVVISPSAAFFYTYFIKGKGSIKKIITSLPPKEKV